MSFGKHPYSCSQGMTHGKDYGGVRVINPFFHRLIELSSTIP